MKKLTVCLSFLVTAFAAPVSQPAYQTGQYILAQALTNAQYKQQQQPQPQTYVQPGFITNPIPAALSKPVTTAESQGGLQRYSTQIRQPIQQVQQQVQQLKSNIERQAELQRVAQASAFFQQLQQQQQIDAQRKAAPPPPPPQPIAIAVPVPQYRPQPQPQYRPQPQPQPQPQYQVQQIQQPQQLQPQFVRVAPQPQPQQIKYVAAPQAGQGYRPRPTPQPQQGGKDLQEDYDPNPSYQFGFHVNDDLYTNYQNRKEQREGNKITGSYSVVDSDGFVRTVTYTADPKDGFRAEVSREPTNIVVKIPKPDPQYQRLPQYSQAVPAQQKEDGERQNLIQYQYQ